MSERTLRKLIVGGQIDEAVQLALARTVHWVEQQLDYEIMSANAENVSSFFQRWLPVLRPFERLQAADWVSVQYILPLVHLEHSYGLGARLYLDAYKAAAAEMAQSLRAFAPLTDGPDAEVAPAVADRLNMYAKTLEKMNFDAQV